jgi:hypothetical protein
LGFKSLIFMDHHKIKPQKWCNVEAIQGIVLGK